MIPKHGGVVIITSRHQMRKVMEKEQGQEEDFILKLSELSLEHSCKLLDAELNGKKGVIPVNFVEDYSPSTAVPPLPVPPPFPYLHLCRFLPLRPAG